MKQLCVLLILLAAVSLEIHGDLWWLEKSRPFGRAGSPLYPTEDATLDLTRITTIPSTTTRNPIELSTKFPTFTKKPNGLNNREITTSRTISTASLTKPVTKIKKPVLIKEESRPVFATTSAPDIMSTQQIQATTSTTTRRSFVIPSYEGQIVFPDDDEVPHQTPKPGPKSTPSEDIVFEKDPAATASTTASSSTTQDCIRNCPVTSEYNPVCGSDGVTYNNPGRLLCSQSCGVKVNMASRGACRSTTVKPSLTTSLPIISTIQMPAVQECIRKCPVTDEFNPMCGSDGVTYMNLGRINCAYLCGISIRVESLGPCVTGTTSSPARVTHSPATRQCIRDCPVTSEYNPLCGSDGFTYTNPRRLLCAQSCGINVEQRARGPCTDISNTSTSSSLSSSTTSPAVQQCMRRCPVTSEYSPICGSDGVTYNNENQLRCAQGCQVDVWQKAYGRCPKTLRQ